ncbi:MAG: citrate/2-methylcitrate synthase [Pirellulales bacterium]
MSETYSPGLENVVAGETAICTLDTGLVYRGYSIEDLAEHSQFEEVAYLLLYGELPKAQELTDFQERLASYSVLPVEIPKILAKLPLDTMPMDVLRTGVSLVSHFYPESPDASAQERQAHAERILAAVPAILSIWQNRQNCSEMPPALEFSGNTYYLARNFLWQARGVMPSNQEVKTLDLTLMLYAEHEFNASTFVTRAITSTRSDLYSAIVGGIGALKGPLHGGANERALADLIEIGSVENVKPWLDRAFAEKRRIMGFGHRVYKHADPRAVVLARHAKELLRGPVDESLEHVAHAVEQEMLTRKGLHPNVDWPCARVYHYLGFDKPFFTPLFVMARVSGWSAHALEQAANNRLIRPRSLYVGPLGKKWRPLREREN